MSIHVLVIDDEEGIRRSVGRLLREEGYKVGTAKDGEEAISIFRNDPYSFDIIICDLIMPGIDGMRTVEEIDCIHPEVTKIILTGYGTLDVAIKAIDFGVDGFITKPFENKELLWKVKECYLKRKMKQFTSQHIFDQLLRDPSSLKPRLTYITVLFSDIRDFTNLSSKLKAEEIARILNRSYFDPLSEIVVRYNGMIDKYIGDSIMALFGAPVYIEDHALKALLCAKEMMNRIKTLDSHIRMGIGISTGQVVTGLFGSKNKKEYTALGMSVNIAARLQKLAKPGEILLSEETKKLLPHELPFEEAGVISIPPLTFNYYKITNDQIL